MVPGEVKQLAHGLTTSKLLLAYNSGSQGQSERPSCWMCCPWAAGELGKPAGWQTASLAEPGEILGWTFLEGPVGSHVEPQVRACAPQTGSPPSKTMGRGRWHPQVTPLVRRQRLWNLLGSPRKAAPYQHPRGLRERQGHAHSPEGKRWCPVQTHGV